MLLSSPVWGTNYCSSISSSSFILLSSICPFEPKLSLISFGAAVIRLRLGFLSYMLTGTTDDIIFWSSVFFDGGSGNFRSCGNDGRIGSAGNDGNTGKLFGARLNKASRIWPLDKSYIFIVRKRDFRKKRHRISFFHAAAPFLNNMKPLL